MKIADWVSFRSKDSYRGFIVYKDGEKSKNNISVRLVEPENLKNKVILVDESDIFVEEFYLDSSDIKVLLDIALLSKDKEWFLELDKQKKSKRT